MRLYLGVIAVPAGGHSKICRRAAGSRSLVAPRLAGGVVWPRMYESGSAELRDGRKGAHGLNKGAAPLLSLLCGLQPISTQSFRLSLRGGKGMRD